MDQTWLYTLIADLVVAFHLAYAAFVLFGFILILIGLAARWRWIRNRTFRLAHLGSIALVAVEAVVGQICPLTTLENWLLVQSGRTSYQGTFFGHLIYDLLYYDLPIWVFTAAYVTLAVLIALTLWLAPPVWRRQRA